MAIPAALLDEIDVTLQQVGSWSLTPDEWGDVTEAMENLLLGLTADDPAVVERCTIAVEELSPTRLGSLADSTATEAQAAPHEILQVAIEIERASAARRFPIGGDADT